MQEKKKYVAFLPLLHCVHLSSKPDTSALKQVLGGCHGYKVTLWAWPSIEVFHSPSLVRWKCTWPNCQSQAFMTSKPDRIHGSSETFVRWQCAAFLKPCWHSQFASQTLATRRLRLLHFENKCSLISLLDLCTWSRYTEKRQISLDLTFGPGSLKWIDAHNHNSSVLSLCIHSWGLNSLPDSDKGPDMQAIYRSATRCRAWICSHQDFDSSNTNWWPT